jgi:hemerythrin superfamily protein
MDAIELLLQDHSRLRDLFDAAERTLNRRLHRLLFGQIRADLRSHSILEEEIFYPAIENFGELTLITHTAQQEHQDLDQLLQRIDQQRPESDDWDSLFRQLSAHVRRHLEFEEREILPVVERLMTRADRERMGRYMSLLKNGSARKTG